MYIGIDIGGTFIKYGVINEFGVSIEKASIATNHTKEILFADLVELVKTYQKNTHQLLAWELVRQELF